MTKAFFTIIIALFFWNKADACKCCARLGEKDAKKVYTGKTIKIKKGKKWNIITFEVTKVYKGHKNKIIKIRTRPTTGWCGFYFEKKKIM